MQTRKKSISLVHLGVLQPRASHTNRSNSSSGNNTPPSDSHPAKRIKRSHTLSGSAPSPPSSLPPKSPNRNRITLNAKDRRRSQPLVQATPPPSPDDYPYSNIDKSTIDDDVVLGVIEQLEGTGNRPHLIKELAAILGTHLHSVKKSSNPVAIISSRLTSFLKRPWTDTSPCPLAKEQVNIQPRRVYYYLTTCARQPIPIGAENPVINSMRIISPSISSGPDDQEQKDLAMETDRDEIQSVHHVREALSPSPELDLHAPEFYMGHHSHTMSFHEPSQFNDLYGHAYQEAASPPLEHEEREFEQTVNDMATRRAGEKSITPSIPEPPSLDHAESSHISESFLASADDVAADQTMCGQEEETEEMRHQRNHEAASALFGGEYGRLGVNTSTHMALTSSPMMRPSLGAKSMPPPIRSTCFGTGNDDAAWDQLKSPDCVELSEIDDLLGG